MSSKMTRTKETNKSNKKVRGVESLILKKGDENQKINLSFKKMLRGHRKIRMNKVMLLMSLMRKTEVMVLRDKNILTIQIRIKKCK